MRIIIDTHIFLWALSSPEKLKPEHRTLVESSANIIYLSSISIAEIMIKRSIGKLKFSTDPIQAAEKCGIELLDFSADAAVTLGDLPYHHKDPFDRMLIAQSIASKVTLMTDDSKFTLYDCKLI